LGILSDLTNGIPEFNEFLAYLLSVHQGWVEADLGPFRKEGDSGPVNSLHFSYNGLDQPAAGGAPHALYLDGEVLAECCLVRPLGNGRGIVPVRCLSLGDGTRALGLQERQALATVSLVAGGIQDFPDAGTTLAAKTVLGARDRIQAEAT
jgi:hypothetical protein